MTTIASDSLISRAIVQVAVKGLTGSERRLLDCVLRVSSQENLHSTMQIALVPEGAEQHADVVLIDTQDRAAYAWAGQQSWLSSRLVIWLDETQAPVPHHFLAQRPLDWPRFPQLIAHVCLNGARNASHDARDAQPKPRRPHVLLVDDSSISRTQVRNLVALRGCDTSEAASVEEGLLLVARKRFDMVFMDIVMPRIDGYEGCRRVKSISRRTGDLPVVMLTTKTSPFDRIRGKMAGCDAYMAKPVDARQLDLVLAQFAPGSHQLPTSVLRQGVYEQQSMGGRTPIIVAG